MTKGDQKDNMPSILQVARFTTPVDITKQVGPEQTHKELSIHQKLVLAALNSTSQPLAMSEIVAYLNSKSDNKKFRDGNVRPYVLELIGMGKVFSRSEMPGERQVRAGGGTFRKSLSATLYSTKNPVPTRTQTEAVPGVVLVDNTGIPWSKTKPWSKKKNEKQSAREKTSKVEPASSNMNQNDMVDYLVQKLVDERTSDIRKELEATKAELQRLRDFLKSAI